MDLNEIRGRVIKVNLARPMKGPVQLGGNRAGGLFSPVHICAHLEYHFLSSVGVRGVATTKSETSRSQWRLVLIVSLMVVPTCHLCPGNQNRTGKQNTQDGGQQDEDMEE